MQRLLCFVVICGLIAGASAFGAQKGIKIRNWRNVETIDVATLKKTIENRVHHVIGLRFIGRGKEIHHLKPNWYQGSLWQLDPDGKGFVSVQVMVAKKDIPTFKAITTNTQSPEVMTVYGEVLRDFERQNFIFVRLMGRNAAVDDKGDATITW